MRNRGGFRPLPNQVSQVHRGEQHNNDEHSNSNTISFWAFVIRISMQSPLYKVPGGPPPPESCSQFAEVGFRAIHRQVADWLRHEFVFFLFLTRLFFLYAASPAKLRHDSIKVEGGCLLARQYDVILDLGRRSP
jgi:hypothetical protein